MAGGDGHAPDAAMKESGLTRFTGLELRGGPEPSLS